VSWAAAADAVNYLDSPYRRRILIAVSADATCFGVAAAIAWFTVRPAPDPLECALAASLMGTLALLALSYCDAYRPTVLGGARSTFLSVALSMGLAFPAALGFYFLLEVPPGVTRAAAHTAALFFPLLLLERAAFRLISSRLEERLLVLGAGDLALCIARALRERPNLGFELVGFLTDDETLQGESIDGSRVLGRMTDLEKLVPNLKIRRIVVASEDRDEFFPAEQLLAAKLFGCRVDCGIVFYERVVGRIYLKNLRLSYLIFSDGFHSGAVSNALKRACDIAMATVALVLASPLLALASVAIRLESNGPVLYRQERVGRHGLVFQLIKLRSMREDAELEVGATFAGPNDDRITRVGRILRATRFDEVPQFWNVLVGQMSVVGPRPERPEFVGMLTQKFPHFRWRSVVKPGITGWAQIRYGYVSDLEEFEHKLSFDLYYLKYRSLTLDLQIVWETAKTVVLLRGT
jgi:exopolysaccharide biosynthesis polyprenyl glycosylphosphotransferase